MPDVNLPVRCVGCHATLTAEIRDFNYGAKTVTEAYVCPVCQHENTIVVAGKLKQVTPKSDVAQRET